MMYIKYMFRVWTCMWLLLYAEATMSQPEASIWMLEQAKKWSW